MLKRLLIGVFAVVGASSLAGAAQAATPSYTTTNVNLRAGPGTTYPVLVTVPVGRAITTYGCLEEYNWCDVSWGAERGWMSASYIQFTFEGQPVYVNPAIAPGRQRLSPEPFAPQSLSALAIPLNGGTAVPPSSHFHKSMNWRAIFAHYFNKLCERTALNQSARVSYTMEGPVADSYRQTALTDLVFGSIHRRP